MKNPLRFPVYKSKQDSFKLHRIEKELSNLINTTDADVKKLDSLRALFEKTQSTAITGFRSIYLPATDHVSLDSLLRMKDLLSVKRVSIHNYHSKDLPAILFQCRNLESLELINTTVSHLPSTLNVLTHLRLVRIYNHAGKKSIKLKDNNHITELIIRGDHPKPLPRSYRSFIALTKLDLAGNNLRRFPQGARQNRKLLELNLQNNKLTLKQRLRKHPYVETLALQHNQIRKVPVSIRHFENLKKLNFNYNLIRSVHPAIRFLTRVENLSFYHNKLSSIPSGIYALKTLSEIDLFYNQIETVDARIRQWQNLKMLYLSHNKILSLPEQIGQLSSLEGLYVWDNRISSLPEALGRIKTLRFLWANNNNLKQLPDALFELENIEELDVSHNFLTGIPEAVFDFKLLKILSLEHNPWNEETMSFMPRRAAELRAKNIFVHIPEIRK